MLRRPSLAAAITLLVAWTVITIGGGLLQAGGQAGLDELVTAGVVWGIPASAALLLAATALRGWRRTLGLVAPTAWRPALVPVLAVTLLLGLSAVSGLPAPATLLLLTVNAAFVGLSEELMFRGVLLSALLARLSVRRAALIGAIAFGAIHSTNAIVTGDLGSAIAQSVMAVGMGLWATAIRIRTGSLLVPVVLHALWDLALFSVLATGEDARLAVAVSGAAVLLIPVLGIWAWRQLGRA
jgi:membrane protease YdiL (CAAX protease family)